MTQANIGRAVPKVVQPFSQRRVSVSTGTRQENPAPAPVVIPGKNEAAAVAPQTGPLPTEGLPKLVQKLSALPQRRNVNENGLRTDGPTLEQYVSAGYAAENYPPQGYAVRLTTFRFAKTRGTTAKTVFPDGTSHQWHPKKTHGGMYLSTTSFETTDAVLAEKLREAGKTDTSIREAPPR